MGLALKQPVFLSVVVEKVLLRGLTLKSEDNNEYLFEVGPARAQTQKPLQYCSCCFLRLSPFIWLTFFFSLHFLHRLSILLLQPRPAGLTVLCRLLSGLGRKWWISYHRSCLPQTRFLATVSTANVFHVARVLLSHDICLFFFTFSKLSTAFPDEGLDQFLPQSAELDPRLAPP